MSENIYIKKLDEATLEVYADDFGIENELNSFFKFHPPGYRFTPAFKNKKWSGWIFLYDIHRKKLPRGLLPYVESFAKNLGYNCVIEPGVIDTDEKTTENLVNSFIDSLDIHSKGRKLDIRNYQREAVYKSLKYKRLILSSPTSSGKSVILYCLLRYLLEQNRKIVLMVPTTSLVNQMYTDFEDYSSENGFDVSEHCHMLYSGKDKITDHPILISTHQSLHSMSKSKKTPRDFFTKFDVFCMDEVHLGVAKTIQELSKSFSNCDYRIGTTGTVQDAKFSKLTLEGAFGPIFKAVTTKELIERKQVTDLKIKCLILEYPKEISKLIKKVEYAKEIDYIVRNENRNKFITNLCKVTKGNTLVLFQFVEKHGKPLYEMIKKRCPDRPVFYISGETHTDNREEIRTGMEKYDNAIIVASIATVATGTNIPSIENIIFSSPSKSKIRNLQSIGRGIRLREGKTHCNLFDIADDFSGGTKKNGYTFNHFKERLNIYNSEGFNFSITNIKFNN